MQGPNDGVETYAKQKRWRCKTCEGTPLAECFGSNAGVGGFSWPFFLAEPPHLADFRICLAALDPGTQTVRPHQLAVWVSARQDTLSLTYLGHEKRKRCSQKQFQSLWIWKEYCSWWRARKTRYLCICFLSSPFILFTSFERTNS